MPDHKRLLPDWIQAYQAYTAESKSPDEFHVWTALAAIAGAIRRRAFFDMSYFLLYPNLYVVLVAPAGKCAKSTCLRLGRQILQQVPGANFTSDSTTREKLIIDLTQAYSDGHSSMTAYSSEFASLLTSSGMDQVVFLTDIYDSPDEWSHTTKTGGRNKIKAPWLNLQGATTPDWLARALPLDTVGIGLTSRIIFVYSETPRIRDWHPKLSEAQVKLKELLVNDLRIVAEIVGEYKMSPAADEIYTQWDLKRQTANQPVEDPRLSGYYERKPMHILKVAMLVAASQSNELLIQDKHLQAALDLLDAIEPNMVRVFSAVGKNPLSYDIEQILGAIIMHKGIDFATLMSMFKHSVRKEELEEVLETLRVMGAVKVTMDEKLGPRYYPTEGA
jgi:hypothetical protein